MRRIALLVLLACAAATSALAQPVSFGFRLGASLPDLKDNSGGDPISSGWSSRRAPYFGITANRPFAPAWSLQAELAYAPQGGLRNGMQVVPDASLAEQFGLPSVPYARFRNEARLEYIELPVLVCRRFGGPLGIDVLAGPYVGRLVAAKNVTTGASPVYLDKAGTTPVAPDAVSFDSDTNVRGDLRPFNWGVQAGVACGRPFRGGRLTLDLRGELGLVDIQRDPANGRNGTGSLILAMGWSQDLDAR